MLGPRFKLSSLNARTALPGSDTQPLHADMVALSDDRGSVVEYIPKYAKRLGAEVRNRGDWIKDEAEKELAEFYRLDQNGAAPIAYLWARTIRCEGPACGANVPLMRSQWLAKKANHSVALQFVPNPEEMHVDFTIIVKQRNGWVDQADLKSPIANPCLDGTVKRGSATCPCCGYTTPVASVREQLKAQNGRADHATLVAVAKTRTGEQGRSPSRRFPRLQRCEKSTKGA